MTRKFIDNANHRKWSKLDPTSSEIISKHRQKKADSVGQFGNEMAEAEAMDLDVGDGMDGMF